MPEIHSLGRRTVQPYKCLRPLLCQSFKGISGWIRLPEIPDRKGHRFVSASKSRGPFRSHTMKAVQITAGLPFRLLSDSIMRRAVLAYVIRIPEGHILKNAFYKLLLISPQDKPLSRHLLPVNLLRQPRSPGKKLCRCLMEYAVIPLHFHVPVIHFILHRHFQAEPDPL